MCAPCKIIINDWHQSAASLADTARRVSLGRENEIYEEPDPTACDDELYELAEAEVEAILRIRRSAVEIAKNRVLESTKRTGDPRSKESAQRWAALVDRLR